MNLIRTIQANESQEWVDLLFVRGPYSGLWEQLLWPHHLPFPCKLRQGLVGGHVYLVYRRRLIAYGDIDRIESRSLDMPVGSGRQPVRSGDTVVLSDVCAHMPAALQQVEVRGFMGPRYTSQSLHALSVRALRTALVDAGVTVY